MPRITVGFYGMTHLGLISAAAAANKGCRVIAYDQDEVLIKQLTQKDYPIEEPKFPEFVAANTDRLCFTIQFDQLLEADLIYLALDVSTDTENYSDLKPINQALEQLRTALRFGQIIVVLSQVSPGFIRKLDFPADQLFYQVETLVFGRAVERASEPERFIIGCANPQKDLPTIYDGFLKKFNCPVLRMRYESAELAKIAINMYLVSSVMTSNMLANLASVVGADWQEVVPTLRSDKRIGQYAYLDPGLGIAGGNLERDVVTVSQLARKYHVRAELIKTWMEDNFHYKNWAWHCLKTEVFLKIKTPVIAILGLAYKPNTHSVKNSPAIELIDLLKETNSRLQVHDPIVKKEAVSEVVYCDSALEALKSADVVVIMTAWSEYSRLTADDFLFQMRGRIIIDPYRVLSSAAIQAGFSVYTLGVDLHTQQELNEAFYA